MSETPLKVICLEAENVKRLKAVRLEPDGSVIRIEGRNGQGKTSILDAIAAALGGGKWQPEKPIRDGESKASVKLNLGELQIERRWTQKGGNYLVVTADGAQLGSPQKVLDKLVGDLTFDPLAFVRMPPKDQADTLRRLAGLDFDKMDAARAQLFEERTMANREYKRYKAGSEPMPNKPKRMQPINVRELADKQQEANTHNRGVDDAERALASLAAAADNYVDDIMGLAKRRKQEKQAALDDLEAADLKYAEEINGLESLKADAATAVIRQEAVVGKMKRREVADLGVEIASAEAHNKALEAYERWHEHEADVKEAEKIADGLTAKIEKIDDDKARKLREAKFPLDGLSVDVNGPTLNGIPFSQASSAEQLRTGVSIGLAESRRARIMLIRDGSLLDADGLADLARIADEFNAQVFVERVADKASPSAVFIEDGEICDG